MTVPYRPSLLLILCLLLLLVGCSSSAARTAPTPSPEPTPEVTPEPTVSLGGWDYAEDTRAIFLSSDKVTEEELREAIAALPSLRKVEYPLCSLDILAQARLHADFPQVEFVWPVVWRDETMDVTAEWLELRDAPDIEELCQILPLFPRLRTVDLGDCVLSNEEAEALAAAAPQTEFLHRVELYGKLYDSRVEELDLSDIPMEDTETVEAALVHFPRLGRVVMKNCGLDNETMAALNERYEDIRFVWVVQVYGRDVPTDNTWFIKYNLPRSKQPGYSYENLRYCTDLIALDLGHGDLKGPELDFLANMPHLRYVVISYSWLEDLTYFSCLQELEYLEIGNTLVKDLSPLLACPKLTDLNIIGTPVSAEQTEVLSQMHQLERLWCSDFIIGTKKIAELEEALPDCYIKAVYSVYSISFGWRLQPKYFLMRDALHMYYQSD